MAFVFTSWYIVLAVLVLALVGTIVAFILMDKKDKVIISEFVKESATEVETETTPSKEATPVEEKKE